MPTGHKVNFRGLFSLVGVLLAWGAIARAASPMAADQFRGRWEGIIEDEPRVVVLNLDGATNSSIVMAAGVPPQPQAWLFRSRVVRVEEGGVLYVEAKDDVGAVMKLRGRGYGKKTAGYIRADVELWGDKKYGPTIFPVVLRYTVPGYFSVVASLITKAEQTGPH